MTWPKNIAACVEEYFQGPDARDVSKSLKTAALDKSYEEMLLCNSAEESLVCLLACMPPVSHSIDMQNCQTLFFVF